MSGMVFPVCDVVVARRLGLHPEEDSEEQHYEKEEDGATDGQSHDHLWVVGWGEKGNVSLHPTNIKHLTCQVLF